jgi:hypothetical protein
VATGGQKTPQRTNPPVGEPADADLQAAASEALAGGDLAKAQTLLAELQRRQAFAGLKPKQPAALRRVK